MTPEGSNKGTLLGWFQSSNLAGVFSPQPLFSRSGYVCVCVWHMCICIHRDPISCISPDSLHLPQLRRPLDFPESSLLAAACFIV